MLNIGTELSLAPQLFFSFLGEVEIDGEGEGFHGTQRPHHEPRFVNSSDLLSFEIFAGWPTRPASWKSQPVPCSPDGGESSAGWRGLAGE